MNRLLAISYDPPRHHEGRTRIGHFRAHTASSNECVVRAAARTGEGFISIPRIIRSLRDECNQPWQREQFPCPAFTGIDAPGPRVHIHSRSRRRRTNGKLRPPCRVPASQIDQIDGIFLDQGVSSRAADGTVVRIREETKRGASVEHWWPKRAWMRVSARTIAPTTRLRIGMAPAAVEHRFIPMSGSFSLSAVILSPRP